MAAQLDPSQSVPDYLMPHAHLVNTYRYPGVARVSTDNVIKWLGEAPKIARDTAPFFWTYLDTPPDGTIYLTWQPMSRLHNELASDGYIWIGREEISYQEIGNGMILEIYTHPAGYRIGDQFATHSRRRFHLLPPKIPVQNQMRAPDPSLWIVQWGRFEGKEMVSVPPLDPRTHALLNTRAQLQRNGHIQRKEFMLSDRVNWPTLPHFSHGRSQPMYAAPSNPRAVPQQMAYPPQGHAATPGPPTKRARYGTAASAGQQPSMATTEGPDDEDDTSRGDLFDQATPREISIDRFTANHEWMEEVLSSPYRIGQIDPVDLGLGLQGGLGSMTEGIFEAQGVGGHEKTVKKPYTGHLDAGLAEEFRKRVIQKVASERADIEKMTARHDKLIARLKANVDVRQAEQELRHADQDGVPEFLRLEGRHEESEEGSGWRHQARHKKVEDIVSRIEASVGRPVQLAHDAQQVQLGGYQEPAPEPIAEPTPEPALQVPAAPTATSGDAASMARQPSGAGSHHSGGMFGDSEDIDMGGTAAGLLDQMHTGMSSTSTPMNNFPTPQPQLSGIPSAVATPANLGAPSPQPQNPPQASRGDAMEGVESGAVHTSDAPVTDPDQGTGSGEWVMVPRGGVSPTPQAAGPSATPSSDAPATSAPPTTEAAPSLALGASKPGSSAPTPADQNDFSSLGDINDYHLPTGGEPGDGLDLNMDMEDSAFGDAFHGVDVSRGSGGSNTPAEGGL